MAEINITIPDGNSYEFEENLRNKTLAFVKETYSADKRDDVKLGHKQKLKDVSAEVKEKHKDIDNEVKEIKKS